jgi:hypothetical protein
MKNAIRQAMGLSLAPVAKTAIKNIDSDITPRAILYIVGKVKGLDPDDVKTIMIPGTSGMIGALSFFHSADAYEIDAMLRAIYDGDAPASDAEASADDADGGTA